MGSIKEDTMQSKSDIRRQILSVRDEMPAGDRMRYDAVIREKVFRQKTYRDAQIILAYVNYRSEVDTRMLIEKALADGKQVFVPKVSGDDMEFWQIQALSDLQSGYRGIPEPAEHVSFPEWMAGRTDTVMMWMPGAAFDKERHRIGYGRGYYDRYLSNMSDEKGGFRIDVRELRLRTAALAYGCQILRRIPYEEHDIKPDMVITEMEIL